MEEVSAYEQVRLDNIKRNEEFLSSIGISEINDSIKTSIASEKPKKASRRGVGMKHKAPAQPVRRSGRMTIERLKAEVSSSSSDLSAEELKKKEDELAAMIEKKATATYEPTLADNGGGGNDRWNRMDSDDLSALKAYNSPDMDEEEEDGKEAKPSTWAAPLLDTLRSLSIAPKSKGKGKGKTGGSSSADYISRISKLKCVEDDVAKVAEHRNCSVWIHPSESKLIVAAGDKSGNIGLWDVDNNEVGVGGVVKYRYHVGNIARIFSFPSSPSEMHSVSYDGTIRSLDLNKDVFSCSFTAPEDIEDMYFQDACELHTGGSKVLVGRSDGYANLIDFRRSNKSYAWTLDIEAKVQSIQHWPTDENLVLTSCSGSEGEISLWDMRKLGNKGTTSKPLATVTGHTKSINAAYASPDGKFIISASQDNTLRLWKGLNDVKSSSSKITSQKVMHDNHTGRWLSTFRPVWDVKHPHSFVMGSMSKPRCVEVFVVDDSASLMSPIALRSEGIASVMSRNAIHPTLDIIAASNSSGRVHIVR
mgnify:CR=1 FL=1